jgi:hypothetical protein
MIPVDTAGAAHVQDNVPQPGAKNAQQLFNQIEGGHRQDLDLPIITEEKPGATGTNETDEHGHFKVPENYPLRQPKPYSEVLLVSYDEIKSLMETKIGFKCDESYMEDQGMEKIEAKILKYQQDSKKNPFYKYILVNIDEVSIIIERFGRSIKRALSDAKIPLKNVNLYAFSTTDTEKIQLHCTKGGFRFYVKPSKAAALDLFRHMAQDEEL